MKRLLIFISIIYLAVSCTGKENKKDQKALPEDLQTTKEITLESGKLYPAISCLSKPDQSYALYLPTTYSDSIPTALFVMFDSHGRGILPVEKYKSLAEDLGVVIACSNNSRNGQNFDQSRQIVETYIADIKARINVDKNKLFTTGFSGGGRVAAQAGFLISDISGVIGCGAGLPTMESAKQVNYEYVLVIGLRDFNFKEIARLENVMNVEHKPYQIVTFEGKHEWPDTSAFKTAMLYLLAKTDSHYLTAYKSIEASNIEKEKQMNDAIAQAHTLKRLSSVFADGEYITKLDKLIKSTQYIELQQTRSGYLQKEESIREAFNTQMIGGNTEYWNLKIDELNESEKIGKMAEERYAASRLKGYLGLVSYLYAEKALRENKLAEAQNFLFIYEKVEPQNPEVHYLKAIFYARQENHNLALLSLEEAVKFGFDEFERINAEPAFKFSEIELDVIRNGRQAQ